MKQRGRKPQEGCLAMRIRLGYSSMTEITRASLEFKIDSNLVQRFESVLRNILLGLKLIESKQFCTEPPPFLHHSAMARSRQYVHIGLFQWQEM